jgi:hypothetical protein
MWNDTGDTPRIFDYFSFLCQLAPLGKCGEMDVGIWKVVHGQTKAVSDACGLNDTSNWLLIML